MKNKLSFLERIDKFLIHGVLSSLALLMASSAFYQSSDLFFKRPSHVGNERYFIIKNKEEQDRINNKLDSLAIYEKELDNLEFNKKSLTAKNYFPFYCENSSDELKKIGQINNSISEVKDNSNHLEKEIKNIPLYKASNLSRKIYSPLLFLVGINFLGLGYLALKFPFPD